MGDVVVFLPTRLGSTRFPGKALADIGGKPLIQRCWESVKDSGFDPFIISSDSVILDKAHKFGAKTLMTSSRPTNGTERVAEASDELGLGPLDVVVNCQADQFGWEDPEFLMVPIKAIQKDVEDKIHTVFSPDCERYDLDSVHAVKVWRHPIQTWIIDFGRTLREDWKLMGLHYGVYVARKRSFDLYLGLDPTEREKDEKLEQLRWPYVLSAHPVKSKPWKVDTPDDVMVYLATR